MKKLLLLSLIFCTGTFSKAQKKESNYPYKEYFEKAYSTYTNVPVGILEAVSYTQTRIHHINDTNHSCFGLPKVYGAMGLTLDGKGYFKDNLRMVSELSGIPVDEIINSPEKNILAFAAAYEKIFLSASFDFNKDGHVNILAKLSELPIDHALQNNFALSSHIYSVLSFMNVPSNQEKFSFPNYNLDLKTILGERNLEIHKSKSIKIEGEEIKDDEGNIFDGKKMYKTMVSTDYGPAIWDAAATCNYSSRNGTLVSAVTIHDVEGTYAGCISWFKNCDAGVSAHYVLRSSDGQVTQMVSEANKAWHVGTENPYTIGFEHEGYRDQDGWYTEAMYNSSANLVKDIINSGYGIDGKRAYHGPSCNDICTLGGCVKIKGHQHYPNQSHSDPGPRWDWYKFYNLINSGTAVVTNTDASGTYYDSGGDAGNYGNDERNLYLISPTNASNVTLNVTAFSLELNWDYLYIYDGNSTSSPLIGRYTGTTIPSTFTSTGGALLLDFRSDCATAGTGWAMNWSSSGADLITPVTSIAVNSSWQKDDFTATFTDTDNSGSIANKFFQVLENNGTEWRANPTAGFYNDNFTSAIHTSWVKPSGYGTWSINAEHLNQTDETVSNTNIYSALTQDSSQIYLYEWSANMSGAAGNRRSGIHFFCDDASLSNRGNSYLVFFRVDNGKLEIYENIANTLNLRSTTLLSVPASTWLNFKVVYNPTTGKMDAYMNDVFIASWTDTTPLKSGGFISLRSGNSNTMFDDVKIYLSRSSSSTIKVGTASSDHVRLENPTTTSNSCRINSIVVDLANNWSARVAENVNIDWTNPSSGISNTENWITGNFNGSFSDNDGTGRIAERYYQALDYNGSAWYANSAKGFFYDDFSTATISTGWTVPAATGTWSVETSSLKQSDVAVANSNIYASLTQSSGYKYYYEWKSYISGTGTNKRSGMHFFSDNGSYTQRGNSYLVWFRNDQSKIEIYETIANSLYVRTTITATIANNTWNKHGVIYDPASGKIEVYLNDQLMGSWTDSSPLTSGSYVSVRNGDCTAKFDDIKTMHSRSSSVQSVTAGTGTSDFRYLNPNSSTPAGKIATIVRDSVWLLSSVSEKTFNTDWTAPSTVSVMDGTAADIDTIQTTTELSANWSSSTDANSGIKNYYYSVGTSAGGVDVAGWTSNGSNTSITISGLSLISGNVYYVNIKVENNAGLYSGVATSDGQRVAMAPVAAFTASATSICSETSVQFISQSTNATDYSWTFTGGTPATSNAQNPVVSYSTPGSYEVKLIASNGSLTSTLIKSGYISVNSVPVTSVTANQTICYGLSANLTASGGTSYLWNTGATTATISVKPLTTTTYSVTANNNGCVGNTVSTIVTVRPKMTTPANPAQSNITSTSVKVSWSSVSGALSYKVRYRKYGTTTWKYLTTSNLYRYISSLLPGTTYEWAVNAYCGTKYTTYTTPMQFTTLSSASAKPMDVDEFENTSFKVYPNPAINSLYIELDNLNGGRVQIEVTDLNGRLIKSEFNPAQSRYIMDVADLPVGIYLIKVKTNESSGVQMLSITR